MLLYNAHAWMHLSIGRADRWLRWGLIEVGVTGLLFLFGLHWGPVGIAVAWTISFFILTIPALWYAGQPIGFAVGPVIALVLRYAVASLLAGWVCVAILSEFHFLTAAPGLAGAAARIAANSLVFTILYGGAVILLHGGCEPYRQIARLVPGPAN